MTLDLTLDREGDAALYRQIAEQIKDRISDGRLPAGTRLPTVRQLAADVGVTRLTIQNAYGELQSGGWVEATVGRGTYVSNTARPASIVATIGQDVTPDAVIGDIVQLTDIVGVRTLASASPDVALFPAHEFGQSLNAHCQDPAAANYASSQGSAPLRVQLSAWLHERGVVADPDDILVTSGVAQGLALTAQALARPGDVVAVEEPTYLGFLHTLKTQGLQSVGVPLDADGPDLDALERVVIQQRPRFFYTIPSFQNPTGVSMSETRRRQLLDLSARHGLMLVEDDIYARLAYDGPPPPTLKSLDRNGLVTHLGSVSKLFTPGLRLGYVVAPPPLNRRLLSLRRANDLCSPPLLQLALADFLERGMMRRHLRRVLPIYRERRDTMLAALQRFMPAGVRWTEPHGGFCTWLTLPADHAFDDLQQAALRAGWAFAPGEAFLSRPTRHKHLRLSFGSQTPANIRHGVEVLAGLIAARMQEQAPAGYDVRDWTPLV